VVNAARDAALNTLAAGIEAEAVDAAARGGIASAGWGDAFRHGTGHGVGLEIHEAPTLSPRGADRLEAGMVVTIEPAIYVEGEFGIRIEDMALVAPSGAERLTTLNTEPILPKAP
jgi:Xaa-Pro aminopeptidase